MFSVIVVGWAVGCDGGRLCSEGEAEVAVGLCPCSRILGREAPGKPDAPGRSEEAHLVEQYNSNSTVMALPVHPVACLHSGARQAL